MRSALRRFPATTEQVFHLDKFLQRERAVPIVLPDAVEDLQLGSTGTFGELDVRALLAVFGVPGLDAAATGWGGGRSAVYRDAATATAAVLVALDWDSEAQRRPVGDGRDDLRGGGLRRGDSDGLRSECVLDSERPNGRLRPPRRPHCAGRCGGCQARRRACSRRHFGRVKTPPERSEASLDSGTRPQVEVEVWAVWSRPLDHAPETSPRDPVSRRRRSISARPPSPDLGFRPGHAAQAAYPTPAPGVPQAGDLEQIFLL